MTVRPSVRSIPGPGSTAQCYAGPAGIVRSEFPFRDLHQVSASGAAFELGRATSPLSVEGVQVRALWDPERNVHTLRVFENEAGLTWDVAEVGRFHVDARGHIITYDLEPGALLSDAENMLVGPVLSVAGQQAGHVMLHASAVEFAGGAIAFSGPSGFGKSTLVASFRDEQLPLVSDDVLPVRFEDQVPVAVPYLPKIKLWAESLAALGADCDAFDPILSWRDKRRVKVEAWGQPGREPVPLRALYLLAPRQDPETPTTFETVEPGRRWQAVHACMYMVDMLRGRRAAVAFDAAIRLAESVPVRVVSYYRSFETLPALREAILRDAEQVTR